MFLETKQDPEGFDMLQNTEQGRADAFRGKIERS